MSEQNAIIIAEVRLAAHVGAPVSRTYGSYTVNVDGRQILSGYTCESRGPGDNADGGCGKRIEANPTGYGLPTQYGTNVSQGFSPDLDPPLPGLAVGQFGMVGSREGILIHPVHQSHLFRSSIGCINLTAPLQPAELMDSTDSRARVIDLINLLRDIRPEAFHSAHWSEISGAKLVVIGEPE